MRSTKDLIEIEALSRSKHTSRFSHAVSKVRKKPRKGTGTSVRKYLNFWFLKIEDPEFSTDSENSASGQSGMDSIRNDLADQNAIFEVVAQEFFRLFIPCHPKTRLVLNEKNDIHYVISKEVPGYIPAESLSKEAIREGLKGGIFTGLGDILVIALLLNEVDLKLGNLGLNENGQFIKIDGDRCFAHINGFNHRDYDITAADIEALPYINDYFAFNWLDLIQYKYISAKKQKAVRTKPESIDASISSSRAFRAEINRAIFKVILLPDEFFKEFIASYAAIESDIEILHREIVERKTQLFDAAMRHQSFREFIVGPDSSKLLREYINDLKRFRTTGKHSLSIEKYESDIIQNYQNVHAHVIKQGMLLRSVRFKTVFFSPKKKQSKDGAAGQYKMSF
jgi:hypothetical protein